MGDKGKTMPKMSRNLTPAEYSVAEQGLLNLALREGITILLNGHDVTLSLITQAPRVNENYDRIHTTPRPRPPVKPDMPRVHKPKSTEAPVKQKFSKPRKATAPAGPPASRKGQSA